MKFKNKMDLSYFAAFCDNTVKLTFLLQSDFYILKTNSVIILDEAPERSLNNDILIDLLSRIIQER